jgi:hypothetical protein
MKEDLESMALVSGMIMVGLGIAFFFAAWKKKSTAMYSNQELMLAPLIFLIIGILLLIPGWGYFYTSGLLQKPQETSASPPRTNSLLGENRSESQTQIEEIKADEQRREQEANSPEHLKKIEDDKVLAKQDCDLAKIEYENNLRELGLSQDVTLRLESSVDSDEFVTVDVYITYNSYDFESRKDLQDQTKNIVGTLLVKYLVIHFPKSHISARLHEDDLNPNWSK